MNRLIIFLGIILVLAFICGVEGCTPTCNKPYILVGTGCCLDQNDNNVCDSDEETKINNTNNTEGAWSKTSGYTVDECKEVCNGFDLRQNVNYCEIACVQEYGKPSASLDKYVNERKELLSQPNHA
jgi:hypothetical protein